MRWLMCSYFRDLSPSVELLLFTIEEEEEEDEGVVGLSGNLLPIHCSIKLILLKIFSLL